MRLSRQPRQIKREYLSLGRLEPAGLKPDIVTDKTYSLPTGQEGRLKLCQRKIAVGFLGGEAGMLYA